MPGASLFDLERAPLTVAWEITRACPLRCVHCRADAQRRRDPRELTAEEGIDLVAQCADLGVRVFVVTGGDPLARPDHLAFLTAAANRGMHVGFSPSVTPRLTREATARALDAGAGTIHLSLDGARARTHDGFRGVRGSFDRTMVALETALELGARVQVGTTVARSTVADLEAMPALLTERLDLWSLFFLVPTGRAQRADMLDAQGHEQVLHWLATDDFPFRVRTTAAPTFRRVLAQHGHAPGPPVNDGRGFAFVSHRGDVCPSGFLQLPVGNVRGAPLAHWYRSSPLFRALRDPAALRGKCGRCEFRELCGGSRARAWALCGDPLAADPTCSHPAAAASS